MSLHLVVRSPTTPCQLDMWKNADILRADVSPLIYPSATELYYTMSLQTSWYRAPLHHVSLPCGWIQTCWGQMYSSPIDPSDTEPYYTMSVWHVEECRHMQVTYTSPSINPSGTEPYYTMSVWHVEQCRCTQVRCTPPANWTQCYRARLHHVSLICGRMQMYQS